MCVKPGAIVKTSKKYVILIGLFGIVIWLLPLVLSSVELKSYIDGERRTVYHQSHPHTLTRDYSIAGIVLSGIYIVPSLLLILGALVDMNWLMMPWLVIAMIYMAGIYNKYKCVPKIKMDSVTIYYSKYFQGNLYIKVLFHFRFYDNDSRYISTSDAFLECCPILRTKTE